MDRVVQVEKISRSLENNPELQELSSAFSLHVHLFVKEAVYFVLLLQGQHALSGHIWMSLAYRTCFCSFVQTDILLSW